VFGTADGTWTSAGVVSDGSYDIPKGLAAFPVASRDGHYEIVRGLEIDEFSQERIDHSVAELLEERSMVIKAGPVPAGPRRGPALWVVPETRRRPWTEVHADQVAHSIVTALQGGPPPPRPGADTVTSFRGSPPNIDRDGPCP
jgi:hypothetical protein